MRGGKWTATKKYELSKHAASKRSSIKNAASERSKHATRKPLAAVIAVVP